MRLNISAEPQGYSWADRLPRARLVFPEVSAAPARATSARAPASLCLRSSSPSPAASGAPAWQHAGSGHRESGPLLPSRKQDKLHAQRSQLQQPPPGTRLTVPTGICALGPAGKRNAAAALRCSRWGQAGGRRGGGGGRLLPCSPGGTGKARRAPSAATGAFLGVGFCRTKHFQLFQAVAEHTKQLGSSKSSAAARAQAPEAGPLTFSTNISGATTCTGPRLPGAPGSQKSRAEQMFTPPESSPCPRGDRGQAVARNPAGGDSVSLQKAAVPQD